MPSDNQPQNHQEVVDRYREKLREQDAIVAQCNRQWSKFAYARGAALLLFIVAAFLAWNEAWAPATWPYYAAGIVLLVFTADAWTVETPESQLRHSRPASTMYRESIARCLRDWNNIKVPEV